MWKDIEPRASRFWIRHAPRSWPGCERPYLELVERRIVWPVSARPADGELAPAATISDLALLPPVEESRSAEKTGLKRAFAEMGGATLDQRIAGESELETADTELATVTTVVDLLASLLSGDLRGLDILPLASVIVVPLLPVASDGAERWSVLLRRLLPRAPLAVLGVSPELVPADRRRLVAALGDPSFEAVHHRRPRGQDLEREFARAVARLGLSPHFERPRVLLPPRAARNRELATVLAEAGELWLALGRSEAEGEALLAAARHVEGATHDVAALAREHQLAHLKFLSALARRAVDEVALAGGSALLAELRAAWIGAEVAA